VNGKKAARYLTAVPPTASGTCRTLEAGTERDYVGRLVPTPLSEILIDQPLRFSVARKAKLCLAHAR